MQDRYQDLLTWLKQSLNDDALTIKPLAGDGSFRRYFRIYQQDQTYVAMDAPPSRENCQPFVNILRLLQQASVIVPTLYQYDLQNGFLLLSDFGDHLLLNELSIDTVDDFYVQALEALLKIQSHCAVHSLDLPRYDQAFIETEIARTSEWYFTKLLKIKWRPPLSKMLQSAFAFITNESLQQPQTFVHRDFHSRNLMILPNKQLGILDFQDAVIGPITYDAVSLIKDCYITWPQEKINHWAQLYQTQLIDQQLLAPCSKQQFMHWFNMVGMQRHIKCLGIFARLGLRDNKRQFLNDIPTVLDYLMVASKGYHELNDFHDFLKDLS